MTLDLAWLIDLSEPCFSILKMEPTEPAWQGSCEIEGNRDKMPSLCSTHDSRSVVLYLGLSRNLLSWDHQNCPAQDHPIPDRASKEQLGQRLVLFPNDILKDEGLPSLVPRAAISHHNHHLYPVLT